MQKNEKKLICFDLDGTLLNKQKEVNEWALEAINHLHDSGHVVCIATGRSLDESLLKIAEKINSKTFIIFNNGNFVYDLQKNDVICLGKPLMKSVPHFFYQKAVMYKRQLILVNSKAEVKRYYFGSQEEFDIKDPLYFVYGVNDRNFEDRSGIKFALMADDIVHVSFKAETEIINKEWENFMVLEEFKMASITKVSQVYIDGDDINVSKWTGIQEVQKLLGISNENTYAFGDSYNDLLMLNNVGKGYCMGNASEDFKKTQKNIIGDNNSDAILKTVMEDILKCS